MVLYFAGDNHPGCAGVVVYLFQIKIGLMNLFEFYLCYFSVFNIIIHLHPNLCSQMNDLKAFLPFYFRWRTLVLAQRCRSST